MPKATPTHTPTARWPSYGKPGNALPLPVIPPFTPAPPPSRRALLAGSTAALLAGAAAATAARAAPAVAGDDAELIALCEQIVAIRAEDEALCTADPGAPDGGPNHARLQELWAEYETVEAQIFEMSDPTTAHGARAAARAALACAPRDAEGEITAGEDLDTWLAFGCVEWLAGRAGV